MTTSKTRLAIALVLAAVCTLPAVSAQATTNATCAPGFSWMDNTQDQQPCLVAAYLQGACGTGTFRVPALPPTEDGQKQGYNPPQQPDSCKCSNAVYNLLSACAACQDGIWLTYDSWMSRGCSAAGFANPDIVFPEIIRVPEETSIPLYAQRDPRGWRGGGFNVTEALAIMASGELPPDDSSSSSSSSGNETSSPSSSPPTTSSETSTSSSSSQNSDSSGGSVPIGPIVGGVVGGVVGLGLIATLALWIICRDRARSRASQGTESEKGTPLKPGLDRSIDPSPAQVPWLANVVVPVPTRPPPTSFPSYLTSSTQVAASPMPYSSSDGMNNGGYFGMVSPAPGALDRGGTITSHPYANGSSLTPSPPIRSDSAGSRLFGRFVFPGRYGRSSMQTRSNGSSESLGSIAILQTPPQHPQSIIQHGQQNSITSQLQPIVGAQTSPSFGGFNPLTDMSIPVPYVLPPVTQDPTHGRNESASSGGHPAKGARRINPPGYGTDTSSNTASEAPEPNPIVPPLQPALAHAPQEVLRPFVVASEMQSPETPSPPSYMAAQAESRAEAELRRAVSSSGTMASSNNVAPLSPVAASPMTPILERASTPPETEYPREKM